MVRVETPKSVSPHGSLSSGPYNIMTRSSGPFKGFGNSGSSTSKTSMLNTRPANRAWLAEERVSRAQTPSHRRDRSASEEPQKHLKRKNKSGSSDGSDGSGDNSSDDEGDSWDKDGSGLYQPSPEPLDNYDGDSPFRGSSPELGDDIQRGPSPSRGSGDDPVSAGSDAEGDDQTRRKLVAMQVEERVELSEAEEELLPEQTHVPELKAPQVVDRGPGAVVFPGSQELPIVSEDALRNEGPVMAELRQKGNSKRNAEPDNAQAAKKPKKGGVIPLVGMDGGPLAAKKADKAPNKPKPPNLAKEKKVTDGAIEAARYEALLASSGSKNDVSALVNGYRSLIGYVVLLSPYEIGCSPGNQRPADSKFGVASVQGSVGPSAFNLASDWTEVEADWIASKIWLDHDGAGRLLPINFKVYRQLHHDADKKMRDRMVALFGALACESLRVACAEALHNSVLYGVHIAKNTTVWTGIANKQSGGGHYSPFMAFHSKVWTMVEVALNKGKQTKTIKRVDLLLFMTTLRLPLNPTPAGEFALGVDEEGHSNIFDECIQELEWKKSKRDAYVPLSGPYFFSLISSIPDWRHLAEEDEDGRFYATILPPAFATQWWRDNRQVPGVMCIFHSIVNELNPDHVRFAKTGGAVTSLEVQAAAKSGDYAIQVARLLGGPEDTKPSRAQKIALILENLDPRVVRPAVQVGIAYTLRTGEAANAISLPAIPRAFLGPAFEDVTWPIMLLIVDKATAKMAKKRILARPLPTVQFPHGPADRETHLRISKQAAAILPSMKDVQPKIIDIDTMDMGLVRSKSSMENDGLVLPQPARNVVLDGFLDTLAILQLLPYGLLDSEETNAQRMERVMALATALGKPTQDHAVKLSQTCTLHPPSERFIEAFDKLVKKEMFLVGGPGWGSKDAESLDWSSSERLHQGRTVAWASEESTHTEES
ncbi:hypothetical protein P7C70_g3795, partial [Phenoliferia sp. Uapishka_3]